MMRSREISSIKKLKQALKKEVALMREQLSNLCEEELSLLERQPSRHQRILSDHSDLVIQLLSVRNVRMDATEQLTKERVLAQRTELLPSDDTISCEINSLIDQVIALTDRINLQNCRNCALFEQMHETEEMPLMCQYPHPLHQTNKKTIVKTVSNIGINI